MSCKCRNKPCSCSDVGLTTGTPCDQDSFSCPPPPACSEVFSSDCIIYTGPSLLKLGDDPNTSVVIPTGISMSEALQIIIDQILDNTNTGGLMYLHTSFIGPTSVGLVWNDTGGPYTVTMKLATDLPVSFVTVATPTTPYITLTDLTSNTEYDIYVSGVDVSLIIRILTT